MIKIDNTKVVGWEAAVRGMRNPMNSWEKSDSVFLDEDGDYYTILGDTGPAYFKGSRKVSIGPNDYDLMMRLRNAGTDHRKFMRMITVYVDITAPLYWWKEFDTYKVGTVENSCSTMHKIHEKEFTLEDFCCEHLMEDEAFAFPLGGGWRGLDALEVLKCTIEALNNARKRYLYTKDKKYWWQMIQLLPSSYNQRRTVMLNYEVLANIYKSRKDHKLDEWHELCDWIKRLPYSELITGFDVDILHPISRKDSEND